MPKFNIPLDMIADGLTSSEDDDPLADAARAQEYDDRWIVSAAMSMANWGKRNSVRFMVEQL